jgi:hypothetical protein
MKVPGMNQKLKIRNSNAEIRMPKFGTRIGLASGLVLLAGALALFMNPGTTIGADDDASWKPFLPAEDFNKLVESEAKAIQDEAAKPKADEKKIRGSALIIALAAINMKDPADAKQVATIRDTAFKLAEASNKPAEAKKLAEVLAKFKELKGDPQASSSPVDLRKKIDDLKDAMDIFGLPNKGGEGIEKEFLILGQQRKPFSAAQLSDKLVMLAYKSALIADVARVHSEQADKKKKDWLRLTDDMRKASQELAESAKGKKAKEAKTALNNLSASCNHCHEAFRDK